MVAHARTLSVFGRHGRGSDRSAAAVATSSSSSSTASVAIAVRAQPTVLSRIERDDAASRSPGAVSIVVFTCGRLYVGIILSDSRGGGRVTHDRGTVCRVSIRSATGTRRLCAGARVRKLKRERDADNRMLRVYGSGTWSESRGKG